MQRVVEVLSSSGAVSPWFMAHMYEVMRAAPRTSTSIDRPLPLFGGDQVREEGRKGGRGTSRGGLWGWSGHGQMQEGGVGLSRQW